MNDNDNAGEGWSQEGDPSGNSNRKKPWSEKPTMEPGKHLLTVDLGKNEAR